MTNPDTILDAIVAKLKLIPSLVTLVGSAGKISAYTDADRALFASVYEMTDKAILVAWMGTAPGIFGDAEVWKHRFSIYARPGVGVRMGTLFHTIITGAITGENLKLPYINFDPPSEMMDTPSAQRIQDEDGIEYFEISFTMSDKDW